MTRWYTSDHHFGHNNIIRYCGRPFPDADTMDNEMVDRWNDLVDDSDEVWILGDLVMGGKTQGLGQPRRPHQGAQNPCARKPRPVLAGPQRPPLGAG